MAKKTTLTTIASIRHKDKRANIPTEELRDFVADAELTPTTMCYPRDPSLDPQLVWKGKDEQDRKDLATPVVPVYIQEKMHPQAIINALRRIEQPGDHQPNLFADFNGGPTDFAQKIDFYHHEQNWTNRLILGDSLLVMTSLAEKEGLKGQVQTIYLDPPYGIKFGSNWQVSTRKRDVKDGKAEDATRQPEQVRAFRDTWKLGIHSYLAYLRDRLMVARDLLTETGSVFVQIGEENVHLVRCVMDEVFGSENSCSLLTVKKTSKIPPEYKTEGDIRKGFVYKRVPHVTLKSIANNPDIKEGMTREQIDAAIARHADTETLYDQPYPDTKRVRVCGPFSVESLSPHRVLSTADESQDSTVTEQEAHKQQDFATMILDNLKKAGVQNTRKSERLTFDRLDPYAGAWLQAAGEYTDADGKTRRVAISIGPEHGTVGPQQVKEAAKEAVQGLGFDMLVVCGFAFDPHVAEEVKRYGKLTVLPTKMNPDLAMGDELLKKTGAGNLFMVFGEPDVEITTQKNGQIVTEIKGVDVYDPTTGQIRSASTDDIACWFIDTDYNGESFFVRHAYFTGADEPYDKLKRALRAEIDEAVWSSLYRTVSRPFDKPDSGKIAVKVINHYGDEVLKVFET